MSIVETAIESLAFNRKRTLGLLESIEQMPDPMAVLGWRPGDGRAHIGWQLMHVGVSEEIFATERLAPHKAGAWQDLWPRFRGGSTPDDRIPEPAQIRAVLDGSREHLLATLRELGDERLGEIPPAFKERGLTVRDLLWLISWHEGHHQGQAHITLNLYKAGK